MTLSPTPERSNDHDRDPRVAVVTGASRGIGRATASLLAHRGAHVWAVARDRGALTSLAADIESDGGRCTPMVTDVGSTESLDHLVAQVRDRHDSVDFLVNNAGLLPTAQRAEATSTYDWNRVLAVNLTSAWHLATTLKPAMRAGSVVVNITSTAASYASVGLAAYCVSKAGLTMLTKALALEWAADGIRVVAVAPGKVDTVLGQPVLRYYEQRGLRPNPLNRIGESSEIAELIGFLVSDRAAFVTGSVVVCDGGELLQHAG